MKRPLKGFGITGLAITFSMNLVALMVFKRVSAVYFSAYWWACWAPSYLVWLVFFALGSARGFKRTARSGPAAS